MSQKVCCWDCIANEMVFDENYTQWCLWRDVHAMLREDDLNKGYNTRRRPLLGITILHQGGMRMIGKVTCHGLSQFTSPQIDQVRIPQWEVFLPKTLPPDWNWNCGVKDSPRSIHIRLNAGHQTTLATPLDKDRRTTYFKMSWFCQKCLQRLNLQKE